MLRRRLLSIPGYLLAWLLLVGGAPLWLPVAAVVDAVRRRGAVCLRGLGFVTIYLTCEMIGLVGAAALWLWRQLLRPPESRWIAAHFRLQNWWGNSVFGALVRLFSLRIEASEGDAELGRGPYLLLVRHASSGDTLLASALVTGPYGMRLRYVLKRELTWDPCLDVVGHRLPNVFIDRGAEDSRVEIERLARLGHDLGPRDGVLVYPEGTRFTPEKRDRIRERLRRTGNEKSLAFAQSIERVLPPRPGGTLALLEAAPEADVVVCAHVGFEGTASIGQVWNGALIGKRVRVQFRRTPREQIPEDPGEVIGWLRREWRRIDAWIASHPA